MISAADGMSIVIALFLILVIVCCGLYLAVLDLRARLRRYE